MEKFDEYCRLLGVRPGESAETVKRSFRARIKALHPDTNARSDKDSAEARLLIEAYQAFKQGVPQPPPRPPAGPRGPSPAERGAGLGDYQRDYQRGREFGRQVFEEVFENRQEYLKDVWINAAGRMFVDDAPRGGFGGTTAFEPEESLYEPRTVERPRRAPRYESDDEILNQLAHPIDQASGYFARAEAALRETVYKFDSKRNRFKGAWVRDYIGALNQVQILFRDVSRRYPAFSLRALHRVRQISELIAEIRKSRSA